MYKVSDLLGKPLLSLSEAGLIGTIVNIYFDEKMSRSTYLMLYNDEEEKCFVPANKLIRSDYDAAVVKSAEIADSAEDSIVSPINSFAFNQDGKALGKITDIIMDGTKVAFFCIDDKQLSSSDLISAGSLLIFNDSGKPIKFKPAIRKEKEVEKKEVEFPVKTAFAPSYDFLIGKKLQRTIVALDGKVIAREGESVTGDIIRNAKKEGKLVILALNSL